MIPKGSDKIQLVKRLKTNFKKVLIWMGLREQREFLRLKYPPAKRPKMHIRGHELQIVDISEKGFRLFKDKDVAIGQMIHGTAEFSSGRSIAVTGKIVWQAENEVGMMISYKPPHIDRDIILEEIRLLLRDMKHKG